MATSSAKNSSSSGGNRQRSSSSRTLPTRKSKSAAAASASSTSASAAKNNSGTKSLQTSSSNNVVVAIESRQEMNNKVHDTPPTGNNNADDSGEKRVPSSPNDNNSSHPSSSSSRPSSSNNSRGRGGSSATSTKELQPAFNLEEIGTIDNHPPPHNHNSSSAHHHHPNHPRQPPPPPQQQQGQPQQQQVHRRSPSPGHGSVISRRGRSRSPVGLTPHPSSSHPSSSRSSSRAGSNNNGRPGSNSSNSNGARRPESRTDASASGGSGRCASVATVQASGGTAAANGGGQELSKAALAAGEAAATTVAGYHHHHHHHHHSPMRSGHANNGGQHNGQHGYGSAHHHTSPYSSSNRGRSPSPVSRFPSMSQSFEISPHQSMSFTGDVAAVGLLGSFDWNIGQQQQQQQQHQGYHPQYHRSDYNDNNGYSTGYRENYREGGSSYHSGHHHNGSPDPYHNHHRGSSRRGRSPSPIAHHHGHRYDDERYDPTGSRYSPQRDYHQPAYSSYHDSSSHHGDSQHHGYHSRGRSPSPSRHPHPHHPGHDDRYYDHHGHSHHSRHARSSSPVTGGEHLPRRNSNGQQALFPEHHILSSHSKDNNHHHHHHHGHRSRSPSGYHGGRMSPPRDHIMGRGSSSNSSPSKKSKSNNKATHRSSVFRGSPTPGRDNLPKDLLLALEEEEEDDDDEEEDTAPPNNTPSKKESSSAITGPANKDGTTGRGGSGSSSGRGTRKPSPAKRGQSESSRASRNSSRGSPTTTTRKQHHRRPSNDIIEPPNNILGPNPSMLIDPSQIDACLQESMMLNVDDYLNANLSFRKSYDLEQVFSFIKEGPNGEKLGTSFNLGFSESKSGEEEGERVGENKSGSKAGKDDNKDGKDGIGHVRRNSKLDIRDALLPTIHTLRSQSMGLTPINSFSGDHNHRAYNGNAPYPGGTLVPLSSMDGMALRAFFSSSPTTTGGPKFNVMEDGSVPPPSGPPPMMGPKSSSAKIGSPSMSGRYGPPPPHPGTSSSPSSTASNAPVIHASTPPSYSHQGLPTGPTHYSGGPPPPSSHPRGGSGAPGGRIYNPAASGTPPHGPSSSGSYKRGPPPPTTGPTPGPISIGFPNKRIKLSTRHSLHPMVDVTKRTNGDFFVLLRKLSSCFGGFKFKLPEMEVGNGSGSNSAVVIAAGNTANSTSGPHTPPSHGGYPASSTLPNDVTMTIAKRRISSSLCAFGGSLPPRTVSPSPSSTTITAASATTNTTSSPNNPSIPNKANAIMVLEESPQEKEERRHYEENLASRYFMKEHSISWDVELHEVIAPKVGLAAGGKRKGGRLSTPKSSKSKQIGVFKKDDSGTPMKFCAPVTPHTPGTPGNTGGAAAGSPSTPGGASGPPGNNAPAGSSASAPPPPPPPTPTSQREKGTKIKYRCKLCGQPKQNHTCPYQSSLVRSIGTMVYPAVNAFISNEPGRCAPPLSEMNNFTSLLSQDASSVAPGSVLSHVGSNLHRGPSFASGLGGGPYRHPPPPHARGGPYGGGPPRNLLTPDTSHWSPNTPGGLSTMSSVGGDPNSPGTPGGINAKSPRLGNLRKRDHHLMLSRSMTRTLSGPPPPGPSLSMPFGPPSMPPAPAGAIPSDVLFRDTMEIKREQYRAVRPAIASSSIIPTTANGPAAASVAASATTISATEGPNAYRYPPIPTPYSQRKELGDTLFALSREVPKLADSCAAILREARERDMWDQAVAELTTQVLVVLKCEEEDYTLEGLRRHLMTLGIAC